MVNPDLLFGRFGNRLFQMAFMYSQVKEGKLPDIYAQDYHLFEKYEEELKKWFGEGIGYLPYVSIHVRREDYVNNPFYVQLWETDYYKKAVDLFPDKKFLVFSDDPVFARTMFPDVEKYQVMENQTELEAFNMAASCESHIIANSSFSWWWAYLSPHWGKSIVAPSSKNWYSDGDERTKCPETWIRI